MDVEITLKRLLVYTSAVAASIAIFVAILRTRARSSRAKPTVIAFLATVVVIRSPSPSRMVSGD